MNKVESLFFRLKKSNSIPHCVVLQGEGDNVSSSADFIGRLILCSGSENSDEFLSCRCPSCIKFKAHTHPDIVYITGKGITNSISVDEIRFMKKDAYIIPTEGENKVYIIKNAQNMTRQAQNAVLKIFEEPPKGVYFIMICQNAQSLLQTICSRAQIYSVDTVSEYSQDNEADDIANAITHSLLIGDKGKILLETSKFYKNKDLFQSTVSQMINIVGKLLRGEYSKVCSDTENIRLTHNEILDLYDIICEVRNILNTNVNLNLLCTYFVTRLSEL